MKNVSERSRACEVSRAPGGYRGSPPIAIGAVVVLSLMAAACSFSTDSRPAPPPPGYRPPPPGYPQQPVAGSIGRQPPPPGYAPQPGYPQPGYPQPGYAPSAVAPGVASFQEPINIAQIQSLVGRNPKACGFLEVAQGVWTRVDCHAYAPAQKSIAHLSPRKALAISNHTTQWKPVKLFGPQFLQGLTQGFSKGIFQGAKGVNGAPAPPVIVGDAPPAAVDHRALGLEGPIKDQGPVGACTAFSLSTTIDNAAIRAGKQQAGQPGQAASANHVWAAYGYPQMGAAADANLGRAIAPMSLWGQSHSESCKIANPIIGDCGSAVSPPVVAGTFRQDPLLVAKSDRADQGGIYRVGAYEKLDTQPAKIEQIVQILASGADLWVAMKIDGFAWSNSKMKGGVIPDWQQENGGHAVTMAGYRETANGKQFLVHNNWGTSWGDGGYGWVSEAMIQKWMHFAYQVKLTDAPKAGEVADDDCGSDQMVDVVKGICGLICPDNSRPANGCVPVQPGQLPQIPGLAPGQLPQIPGFPPFGR